MSDDRPPRPEPLQPEIENAPDTLVEKDQWVCWRYEWKSDRNEWTKAPVDVSGGYASSTGPDTWTTFEAAADHHTDDSTDTDGIGFVVTESDMIVGGDLDDCRDPDSGELEGWAGMLLDEIDTYTEVSPSGTGLRWFGVGKMPDGKTRSGIDDAEGHFEMYEKGRYLTLTGHHVEATPEDVQTRPQAIEAVHDQYIAESNPEEDGSPDAKGGGNADTTLDDEDLISVAKDADDDGYFEDLYNGRWEKHTSKWEGDSHSEARMAFASKLAFYTGSDEKQMLRIFKDSDLCRGEDDIRTFKEYEAPKAAKDQSDHYDPDSHDSGDDSPETPDNPQPPEDGDSDDDSDEEVADTTRLAPDEVLAWAGLNPEESSISDLDDRERAAATWTLLSESDEYHVRVRRDNGSLWAYDGGVWEPNGERTLRHAAALALGKMNYGANVLSEMKAQARADPAVEIDLDDMGLDAGEIAVENGRVDLREAADGGEALEELTPEDHALTQLPVEYDPEAEYDEWENYVEEWAENGRADALQEYVGYCLHVGELPIHRALLLVGTGANGKGTFLSVVRELLGRDNTTSVELQTLANERDAVAEFYGALANIDDDLSSRKLGNGIGMFKKMVAGDRIRGRRLYEDGFEFDAVGKHLYAANEVPDVSVPDEDEAFWRRWLLVEFPNHYPPEERDPTLGDRLTEPENLSGVLNWAIEGWARLMEQGYFTGEDRHAHQKRERWQAWGESVDKFISECVENDPDADRITTGEAHQRYAAWCRLNDLDPVGQRKFTGELKGEDVGYKSSIRIDGSPQRGYAELGLADEVPAVENTPDREPDENATAIDEFDEDDDTDEEDDEDDGVGWGAAREKIADLTEPGDELDPEELDDRTDDPLSYWVSALEHLAIADEVEEVVADGDQYRRE